MRALVKEQAGPGLALVEVPDPVPGPNDVLVRVLRTGICGTDLHIQAWDDWAARTVTAPLVVGHEFVGEVAAVGSAVGVDGGGPAVGDLVGGEGHIVCGTCRNCMAGRRHLCDRSKGIGVHRDGAFAEYLVLPASNVWVHRITGLDLDVAAIFDPFGNAVHTALKFPVLGEDVLVAGAGPIGLMAAAVVAHAGARNVVVTDVSPQRLDLARKVGATLAVDVRTTSLADVQRTIGLKEGFDVGLEMSGQPAALQDMIANMVAGGRIAMLGLPAAPFAVDFGRVVTRMITLQGIYGREMFETWYEMTVLLERGLDISPVITDRFSAADFERAFDTARGGGSGKVILDWTRL
ncbi:L-threonine 3-dehydrogenase [Kineosporia sp. R_H_3]|uniref:L-threonine 3-dehydrogenase n=1 Tax=Kineosporia sp. R_H_3 TaxID=1961848 RepID=UPI000B4B2C93|nr:L-threonine 3-dehydrogenase [Kineosporia sp. R_H_3]